VSDDQAGRSKGETGDTPLSTGTGGEPSNSVDNSPVDVRNIRLVPSEAPLSPVDNVNNVRNTAHNSLSDAYLDDSSTQSYETDEPLDRMGDSGFAPADDVAADALDRARRLVRATPNSRRSPRRPGGVSSAGPQRSGGYSGSGPDERDPQRLGMVAGAAFRERGWDAQLASHRVMSDWAGLVGADVAAQCSPVSLTAGELRISASSSAWATQLRLMSSTILARIVAQVGPEVVRRIIIVGPTSPSWKHGLWSVPGRGPRDTYG
jgi:predicted nucleic acid-binding Zn ribbon protein